MGSFDHSLAVDEYIIPSGSEALSTKCLSIPFWPLSSDTGMGQHHSTYALVPYARTQICRCRFESRNFPETRPMSPKRPATVLYTSYLCNPQATATLGWSKSSLLTAISPEQKHRSRQGLPSISPRRRNLGPLSRAYSLLTMPKTIRESSSNILYGWGGCVKSTSIQSSELVFEGSRNPIRKAPPNRKDFMIPELEALSQIEPMPICFKLNS
jgi:hypothetical protein